MLTETQKNNISKLSLDDSLEILQIIAESKGIVSIKDYSEITTTPLRSVYDGVNRNKIKSVDMCGYKFPIVNV